MTPLISATDLAARLGEENLRIVDATVHLTFDADGAHVASGRETYLAGHLPGAVFVDVATALAAPASPERGRHPLPTPEDFAAAMSRAASVSSPAARSSSSTAGR